jgi:predicted ferric reductase
MGRGLEISDKEKGKFVIMAAGTGILPFLDLLDFLLKKAISLSLKKKGASSEVKVYPKQDY